ncbi:MAG TPA: TolC family protein [Phnomibacter sp.]|nr:TolC family protein [Phnomibacter sp.]
MKRIINTCIAILLWLIGTAQEVPVFTLDSIMVRIQAGNPSLQTFALRAESYRYSAEAATAWMAPMVGVGTFMTPYPGQKDVMDGDRGSLMLRFEQTIPGRAKQQAKKDYILSQAAAEQLGKDVLYNDYRAKARSLYHSWVINKKRLLILDESNRLMETMKKMEEVRVPYGQGSIANVYKAEARIEENNNMAVMYRGEIAKSRAYLNSLMNLPGDLVFDIDEQVFPAPLPSVTDTLQLAISRKDIARMDANIQSMQMGIRSMELERRPDFRVAFDHMQPLGRTMPYAFSVMGMISVPIVPWARKMYKNEVKAMEYNISAMQMERSAMLTETRSMLFGMQAEIRSMEQRITNLETKIIPVVQRAFDLSYIGYQDNRAPIATVLSDWEALVMMKMNVLDERQKLFEMMVNYEKELYQ